MAALSRRRIYLLAFLAWTVVGLYFAVQTYFNPAVMPPMRWSQAITVNLTYYYAWGLATPLVIALARRFPFDGGRWPRALAAHALASVVVTAAALLTAETVLTLLNRRPSYALVQKLSFAFGVNFFSSLPTYWLILFVWFTLHYYARYRDRELRATQLEGQLSHAQLQALKAQLNPHFLFNTLNSVSALMYSDVDSADAMLARLSEFLRLTLDGDLRQEIPLEQEVDFVRRYLEIEKIRFEERLQVTIDVGGDARAAMVPSLALQPLVENAIHHGIAPRPEGGAIAIRAAREDGYLHLSVADDGIGARGEPRERIGLANTRARLEQLYGDAHSMTLTDVQPRGFRVDIRLPFRTEAAT